MSSKKEKVSADNVHSILYEQYRFSINNLWRNFGNSWTFENVIFIGYGLILMRLIDSGPNTVVLLNFITSCLTVLGLVSSSLFIALSKASKIWQHVYEERIRPFELDPDVFPFDRKYSLDFSPAVINLDTSLLTQNPGKFSTGRIHIFIFQVIWGIWALLFVIHRFYAFYLCYVGSIFVSICFVALVIFFIFKMKRDVENRYLSNEYHDNPDFIYSVYLDLEKAEDIICGMPIDVNRFKFFVSNFYETVCRHLDDLYESKGRKTSDTRMSYRRLKDNFQRAYVEGQVGLRDGEWSFESIVTKFLDEITEQKEIVRSLYGR